MYRNIGFLEYDAIFIQLPTKTLDNFSGVAKIANTIKKDATRLKEIGITNLPSCIYTTWLLYGLLSEYNGFKMILANKKRANESEGDKKVLDFDFVLKKLLSISKDSTAPNDSRLLKTFALKSRVKDKSHSNKMCSYCSKSGHSHRSCYYKHPEKTSDTF